MVDTANVHISSPNQQMAEAEARRGDDNAVFYAKQPAWFADLSASPRDPELWKNVTVCGPRDTSTARVRSRGLTRSVLEKRGA